MSDSGKLEDANIQTRDEGGDDEVRAWSFYAFSRPRPGYAPPPGQFAVSLAFQKKKWALMTRAVGRDISNEEAGRGDGS